MSKPTQDELKVFLKHIDTLIGFEAANRVIRGYGCFKASDLPIPEFSKVYDWITDEAGIPIKIETLKLDSEIPSDTCL